jgi:Protein of unknown function (DUF3570)
LKLHLKNRLRQAKVKTQIDAAAVQASHASVFSGTSPLAALACAALALPGFSALTSRAHAENAPENGLIAFKYLRYQDSQPGLQRIKVDAPSVSLLAPIAGSWSVEASAVVDSLSGATPTSHSTISSATKKNSTGTGGMSDYRKAGDVKLTKYFSRAAVSLGYSTGQENDYDAKGYSLDGRWSTEDNNTTFNVGFGHDNDKILAPNPAVRLGSSAAVNGRKLTDQLIVGVTQVISANDIAQVNFSYSDGKSRDMVVGTSAFNDAYKKFDTRPTTRKSSVLLTRWNHHFASNGSSLKLSYRYYADSFKVSSHTVGVDWAVPVGNLTVTPSARYFSQSAADFYVDYVPDGTPDSNGGILNCFYSNLCGKQFVSFDQRLAAFGAVTVGLKASYKLTKEWTMDGKAELYQQRSNWRLAGKGSPGLDTFNAQFYQVGVSRSF